MHPDRGSEGPSEPFPDLRATSSTHPEDRFPDTNERYPEHSAEDRPWPVEVGPLPLPPSSQPDADRTDGDPLRMEDVLSELGIEPEAYRDEASAERRGEEADGS